MWTSTETTSRLEAFALSGTKHYIGTDLVSFTNNGKMPPITGLVFELDDNTTITVGDDTGTVLRQSCPHITLSMAEAQLARLKGYEYQMMDVQAGELDPSSELGDGVTANGVYTVLSRVSDGGDGYPDISAPGEQELEDEYPTRGEGPLTQQFKRENAAIRSSIIKTASEITAKVEGVGGAVTTLTETVDGIKGTVTGLNGAFSEVEQTVNGWSYKDNEGTVKIKGGVIDASSLVLSDCLAFTDMGNSVSGLSGDLTKLVKGEYENQTGTTFITKNEIHSGKFFGCQYYNNEHSGYVDMAEDDSGLPIFRFVSSQKREDDSGRGVYLYVTGKGETYNAALGTADFAPGSYSDPHYIVSVSMSEQGNLFADTGSLWLGGDVLRTEFSNDSLSDRYVDGTLPQGTWDFKECTVRNLTAVFA